MEKKKLVDRIGQFTTVPNSVYKLIPEIGKDAFMVFVCLRNHSDEKDVSFPSYDLICQETTLTRSRVSKALKVLEEAELLIRKQRFSASTIYLLQMPPISPPVELMAENGTPLVQHPDSISPPVELPLVQGVDANQIQLTRLKEPDPIGTAAAVYSFHDHQTRDINRLYTQITGQMAIPAQSVDAVQNDMGIVLDSYNGKEEDEIITDGKRHYSEWCSTRSEKTGKYYSKLNPAWITRWLETLSPEPEQARVVEIPKPTAICEYGDRLRKQAEASQGRHDFSMRLQDYRSHIEDCRICGEATTAPQVQQELKNLAERMRVK